MALNIILTGLKCCKCYTFIKTRKAFSNLRSDSTNTAKMKRKSTHTVSSQAKCTKSTTFPYARERSGFSILGL